MDIWLIYRIFKNINSGRIEKIIPIEYCKTENEAHKYNRLFDLQIPIDLRDRISHKYHHGYTHEEIN